MGSDATRLATVAADRAGHRTPGACLGFTSHPAEDRRSRFFGRRRPKDDELSRLRDWIARTQGPEALSATEAISQAQAEAARILEQAEADAAAVRSEARTTIEQEAADMRAAAQTADNARAELRRQTQTETASVLQQAKAEADVLRADARAAVKRDTAEMKTMQKAVDRARRELEKSQRELYTLETKIAQARADVVVTEEAQMLQQVGVYTYQHPLQDAVAYRTRLDTLQAEIKQLVRAGRAVESITNWNVNGSAREGKKMVQDFSKLMLRAYNAEADQAVRTMRPHRVNPLVDRLYKTRETIAKPGLTMRIRIADDYHDARVRELWLTADYLQKKEEEKETQRELRARQREEERAQRDFDREREKLNKELQHVQSALQKLRERGDYAGTADLEGKLVEIEGALRNVEARAANIRTGYVYVISNIGAFGDRMVKIGLTRRLEPLDRIYELSGAAVPFRFDVHALIFSEDAVGLETKLHQHFADRRVNHVNTRREFFYVTPTEVRDALQKFAGQHLVEFVDEPEALEWRASSPRQQRPGTHDQQGPDEHIPA